MWYFERFQSFLRSTFLYFSSSIYFNNKKREKRNDFCSFARRMTTTLCGGALAECFGVVCRRNVAARIDDSDGRMTIEKSARPICEAAHRNAPYVTRWMPSLIRRVPSLQLRTCWNVVVTSPSAGFSWFLAIYCRQSAPRSLRKRGPLFVKIVGFEQLCSANASSLLIEFSSAGRLRHRFTVYGAFHDAIIGENPVLRSPPPTN